MPTEPIVLCVNDTSWELKTSFPDRIFAEETPTVAGGKPAGKKINNSQRYNDFREGRHKI